MPEKERIEDKAIPQQEKEERFQTLIRTSFEWWIIIIF